MTKRLKYQKEIDGLKEICPPRNVLQTKIFSYRFSNEDIKHEKNFLPPAKLYPKRINNEKGKCKLFGLSFFTTEELAKKTYVTVRKAMQKNGYTHLINGYLDEDDGLQTPPNKNGHLALYEFEEKPVELEEKFEIISKL